MTNFILIKGFQKFIRISPQIAFTLNLLLFIAICVNLSSCNEEEAVETRTKNDNPYIKYFKNHQSKNEISPRSRMYPISQAIDYLNDGMNYIYCRPSDYYLEVSVFQDTFTIPVSSGEIDEDDLISLMDDIAEFAGDNYYEDTRTEKEPLLFNMRQLSSASPYYTYIEASFLMEAGSPTSTYDEYPYDDSWIFGAFGENVSNECNHEVANNDAADLFRRDLRKNLIYRNSSGDYYFKNPSGICYNPYGGDCLFVWYLTPIFPIDINYLNSDLLYGGDDIPGDNMYDYQLFKNYNYYANYNECLDDSEMNFYYETMASLALDNVPYPPGNKVIAQIEVGYDQYSFFGHTHIWHVMEVVIVDKAVVLEPEDLEAYPLPCCN